MPHRSVYEQYPRGAAPIRSPANAADALFGKECEGLPTRPLEPAGRSLLAAAGASRTPPSQIVTRTRCSSIPGADTLRNPAGSTRITWRAVPHSCKRRRPSCLADARTDGKAKEPRARRASDGLVERFGLA